MFLPNPSALGLISNLFIGNNTIDSDSRTNVIGSALYIDGLFVQISNLTVSNNTLLNGENSKLIVLSCFSDITNVSLKNNFINGFLLDLRINSNI